MIVLRALWGMTDSLEHNIERIAAAGYDGVESGIHHLGDHTPASFAALLDRHNLKFIAQGFIADKDDLDTTLKQLAAFNPLKINLHSGRDSMTRDEASGFFEEALRVEDEIGVPVAHETHRGRVFFNPWDTAYYLHQFDTLKITADYSHWVNVCERLPDDQQDALDLANSRAIHIHGRVGYEEGPQVPDPSALEYARYLEWHEGQWRKIKAQQDGPMTFVPEYGPPRYLHTLPHTDVPVADLWDICLWAANRAREQLGD